MSARYPNPTLLRRSHFGDLYRATDRDTGGEVVLRRLFDAKTAAADPEQLAALERRSERLAALHHDNVGAILGSGSDEDGGFVVSEWIEGSDLTAIVSDAALTLDDFSNLARQTLDGLDAIHRHQLIHGSLHPGRVVIKWLPDQSAQFKITDLGLAELLGSAELVTTDASGNYTGVLDCLAPELFDGEPGNIRSDLYALGNVYYYALTQRLPFAADSADGTIGNHRAGDAKPVGEFRQDLPGPLADWVMNLISLAADDRPETVAIASEGFAAAVGDQDTAPPADVVESAPPVAATSEASQEVASADDEASPDEDSAAPIEATAEVDATPTPKTARVGVRADAVAAQGTGTEAKAPVKQGKPGKRTPAWIQAAAVGLLAVGLGLIAYFVLLNPSDEEDPGVAASPPDQGSGSTPTASVELPTTTDGSQPEASPALVDPHLPPVTDALLAQYTFDKHDGAADAPAQEVTEWPKKNGVGEIGSLNVFGVDSSSGSAARRIVATPIDFPALNGTHSLLQLNGTATLDVEWKRNDKDFRSGDQITCISVFWSPEKDAELIRLHPPINDEGAITTKIVNGAVISDIRFLQTPYPLTPFPHGNQLIGLSVVWVGNQDNARNHILTATGKRFSSVLNPAPNRPMKISSLHLGGSNAPLATDRPSGIYFAELLLYDRALSDEEVALIDEYLTSKYFK